MNDNVKYTLERCDKQAQVHRFKSANLDYYFFKKLYKALYSFLSESEKEAFKSWHDEARRLLDTKDYSLTDSIEDSLTEASMILEDKIIALESAND